MKTLLKVLSAAGLIALIAAFPRAAGSTDTGKRKKVQPPAKILDKIDSRDYIIDIEWDTYGPGETKEGFMHISGDTLTEYTRLEENIIFEPLAPKRIPKGSACFKYKIWDYNQSVDRKGNIHIFFSIDTDGGIPYISDTIGYRVVIDNVTVVREWLKFHTDLPWSRSRYSIKISPDGTVRVGEGDYFGRMRL